MVTDNETWLIETGDLVIRKKASSSLLSLSDIERAIYCFWVIDYSVRNSGTLGAVGDLYPGAFLELSQYARTNNVSHLALISETANTTDEGFCENYYRLFEAACDDIRAVYQRTEQIVGPERR